MWLFEQEEDLQSGTDESASDEKCFEAGKIDILRVHSTFVSALKKT